MRHVKLYCEPHKIETLSNTSVDYFVLRALQEAKKVQKNFIGLRSDSYNYTHRVVTELPPLIISFHAVSF